jgi:ribosome-associated protein
MATETENNPPNPEGANTDGADDLGQPTPEALARLAVDVGSDKLASDILMLDISEVSNFADYFVIASVHSARQLGALAEDLEEALEDAGAQKLRREGGPQSGWVVVDFGDVVIHLFGVEERDYYNLAGAWPGASEVVRIQ